MFLWHWIMCLFVGRKTVVIYIYIYIYFYRAKNGFPEALSMCEREKNLARKLWIQWNMKDILFFAFLPPLSGSKQLWFTKYVVHCQTKLTFKGTTAYHLESTLKETALYITQRCILHTGVLICKVEGIVHLKKKHFLKIYSPSCHKRCRWVCFFNRTDLEKFSIASLTH